jgi:hypothetical protein
MPGKYQLTGVVPVNCGKQNDKKNQRRKNNTGFPEIIPPETPIF